MPDIRTHILTHHRVELIQRCMMYRASVSLNGSEYARVRLTEEEAVEALIKRCEKTFLPEVVQIQEVMPSSWHRWKNNKCVRCGISRKRKYWKLLMAITNHPPYNHYKASNSWWYGEEHKFQRTNCNSKKINNNESNS
jgi:hypothetical protein